MFSLYEPKIVTCVFVTGSRCCVFGLNTSVVLRTIWPYGAKSINRRFTAPWPGPYGFVVAKISSGICGNNSLIRPRASFGESLSEVNDERLHDIMRSNNSSVGYLHSSFQPMNGYSCP